MHVLADYWNNSLSARGVFKLKYFLRLKCHIPISNYKEFLQVVSKFLNA